MRISGWLLLGSSLSVAACTAPHFTPDYACDAGCDELADAGSLADASERPPHPDSHPDGGRGVPGAHDGGSESDASSAGEPCTEAEASRVDTRVRYREASGTKQKPCALEVQTRTCHDGTWSAWTGTFSESQCVMRKLRRS
jgi:hypothetical protein